MKPAPAISLAVCLLGMSSADILRAAEGKNYTEPLPGMDADSRFWNGELSTGWDSLYMYYGVNVLRDGLDYGSGLHWTDLSVTFNLSENDFLSIGSWFAFGFDRSAYKELDAFLAYTRTYGNFSLGFGYTFYDIQPGPFYSNELNFKAGYAIEFPSNITLTPSIAYFLNLGPDVADGQGVSKTGASFLQARIDAEIPLDKNIVALAPWIAFGASFDYNFREDGSCYTGANNFEAGLGVPIRINETITIYGYCAFSTQWANLVGTRPNTIWGGTKITFAF